jgi:hypothetical protein
MEAEAEEEGGRWGHTSPQRAQQAAVLSHRTGRQPSPHQLRQATQQRQVAHHAPHI